MEIKQRLEYLRGEIRAERISYSEIYELQSLKEHIEDGDIELLQWAGVDEFEEEYCNCILCKHPFIIGETGNELGFCINCQEKKDFPYDLNKYYEDHNNNKVAFKGFDTMARGLLENYKK